MAGSEHERAAFVQDMTRMSPKRASILRSLEAVETAATDAAANGTPKFSCDTTLALGHATIERLADMVDQGIGIPDILASLEIGFAISLCHVISLIALNTGDNAERLGEQMMTAISDRTMNSIERLSRPARPARR